MILLREKDKKEIERLAKLAIKTPSQIWAYGSRVKGDAHDTSDLDLVIVTEDKATLDIDELLDFREHLKKSNIPILNTGARLESNTKKFSCQYIGKLRSTC